MCPRRLRSRLPALALAACFGGLGWWAFSSAQERQAQEASIAGQLISGPYTHQNLTLFLIRGRDRISGRSFLTLKEALAEKKVVVHETENVNELAIENLTKDAEIFVQAGEIVRGGKQDRVIAFDLILKPKSGRIPIGAFCVEQGRWRQRGAEPLMHFSASDNLASSNALKLAITRDANQGKVWNEVARTQSRLSYTLGGSVADASSATSLELSLEGEKVQESVEAYVKELSKLIRDQEDAVGLIVAINGTLQGGDVYASPGLFRKLCPKLLESSATEAVASRQDKKAATLPSVADVQRLLVAAEDAKADAKEIASCVRIVTRESTDWVMFETFDLKDPKTWIHRNYIRKLPKAAP